MMNRRALGCDPADRSRRTVVHALHRRSDPQQLRHLLTATAFSKTNLLEPLAGARPRSSVWVCRRLYIGDVPTLRLFAAAREAAGVGADTIEGSPVGEVLDAARARYGERVDAVLPTCRVWVNGAAAEEATAVDTADEVALLPPVSGGCS